MKTLHTALGEVPLMSFQTLLDNVPRQTGFTDHLAQFHTKVQHSFQFEGSDPTEEVATYQRRCLPLAPFDDPKQIAGLLERDFLMQANLGHLWKAPKTELYEETIIRHMEQFGTPDALLEVAGLLFCVSFSDFRVIEGPKGVALACLNQLRHTAYQVSDLTQAEANSLAAKLQGPV